MESIELCNTYNSVCRYFIILPYIVSTDFAKKEKKNKNKAYAYFLAAKFTLQSKAICKTQFHLLTNFGGISNRIVVLIPQEVTVSRSNLFEFIHLFMILHTILHVSKTVLWHFVMYHFSKNDQIAILFSYRS